MQPLSALLENDGPALWSHYGELCRRGKETQKSVLEALVASNAACTFGRAFHFDAIHSIADFQRAVPISKWLDIEPYIDELIQSGGDVLTSNDPVLRYNLSSGTTGKRKLVPVTQRGRLANAITLKLRLLLAMRDNPAALRGRVLPFAYMSTRGRTPLDIPYGSPSAASAANAPPEMARTFAYPAPVLDIWDADARKYAMVRFALANGLSAAAGNNPLSFVRLFELAKDQRERLLEDIRRGTFTPPADVCEEVLQKLAPHLKPDAERAAFLATHSDFLPKNYWPDLKLFLCWKTGLMGRLIPELATLCAEGTVVREFGYGASEGLFTIPLSNESSEGVLAMHGIFYEFLPEGEAASPDAKTLLAHELSPGRRYQLLLTSSSGLYRYAIDDIVEVTGFLGEAPILVFVRKAGDIVNMVGEKLDSSQVVAAMQRAQAETGVRVRHFQWITDKASLRYELCVEPMDEREDEARFQALLERFERALARQVRPYEAYREEGLIAAPRMRVMERGWLRSILETGEDASAEVKPRVVGEELAYAHFSKRIIQSSNHLGESRATS